MSKPIPSFDQQIAAHRAPKRPIEIARQLGERLPVEDAKPKPKAKARPRHTPGQMNKLEASYAAHLDLLKLAGEVIAWEFEAVKFKLAEDRCWYNPDFLVHRADGVLEVVDCKGFVEDDSLVKVKCAAERFHQFLFVFVSKVKGEWTRREF